MIRGCIAGLVIALLVWAVILGAGAGTVWMLNTLFRAELPYSLRVLFAAALFNLFVGWAGAAPWFLMSMSARRTQ